MFRKRRAPSMEELQALEEMDQKSKPIRRNELIDESEQQPSQIEEEETEETEQEEKKKDRKAGKLLRSRFLGRSMFDNPGCCFGNTLVWRVNL